MRNNNTTVAPSSAQPAQPRVEVDPSMFDLSDWVVDTAIDDGSSAFPMGFDGTPEETPLDTPDDHFGSASVDAEILPPMPCFGAEFTPSKTDSAPAQGTATVFESFDFTHLFHPDAAIVAAPTTKSTLPPLELAPFVIDQTPALESVPLPPSEFSLPQSSSTATDMIYPNAHASSSSSSTETPSRTTKPLPTGIRRNITVDKLVPLDAPTQSRHYITESSTSRKVVPAAFKKKRGISEVEADPTDLDAIEEKRRKNTLAARKSRARKLETLTTLQQAVDVANGERDYWQQRALHAEDVLRQHGLSNPAAVEFVPQTPSLS